MLHAPDFVEIIDFRGLFRVLEQYIAAITWCATAAGIGGERGLQKQF